MTACGLDFGTSNSGVALPEGDSVRLLPLEAGATGIPSAVFFAIDPPPSVCYGREAVRTHIEPGLSATARRDALIALLADLLARLVTLGTATVHAAGLQPAAISTLYFTGGSSGMTALREAFQGAFPASRVVVGDLFGSVVSGLGIEAGRRFR